MKPIVEKSNSQIVFRKSSKPLLSVLSFTFSLFSFSPTLALSSTSRLSMASKKKATQAELETELEDSIECLRQVSQSSSCRAAISPHHSTSSQLGIVLENYGGPQHEANYFDRINELVDHLKKIHSMKDAVQETVPLSVIEDYLDKGLTPELYTKHRLKVAEAYNQQTKGRIDSLRLLHDHVRR
eukprot:766894-Hanusia_phi.AAC.8